jgi:hypothetical protein
MRLGPCRVCGAPTRLAFESRLLDRNVRYEACDACAYLQTETPDWLDRAYSSAINAADTGILDRNQRNVQRVIGTLKALRRLHGRVVDHAGGYGVLVRLLRDAGVDAYWKDKYCDNLLARGFEARDERYELVTAFEVFEHFVNPTEELRSMMLVAPTVLLSTELIPMATDPEPSWWYLGPDHGQHIGFFREQTLRHIARATNCHFASDGHSLHLFSTLPIPRSWRALSTLPALGRLVQRFALRSKIEEDFHRALEAGRDMSQPS